MRTSNPILKERAFTAATTDQVMTIEGAVNKTIVLLALLVIGAGWTWNLFYNQGSSVVKPWMLGGLVGVGLVFLVLFFAPRFSPILAPVYAVCEGFMLGGLSAVFEQRYPGMIFQAVVLTFAIFFSLLMAYKMSLIRSTPAFRRGIISATLGVALVYFVSLIGQLFGWQVPYVHDSGPIGIGFSVVVVVIAALNLVLDFDFIERMARKQVPQYMEWYAAFGLIVTLAWLYLEILRLLSKLRSR